MFNVAAAVSLVMAVATASLWVRSYWRVDTLVVDWAYQDLHPWCRTTYNVQAWRGGVIAARFCRVPAEWPDVGAVQLLLHRPCVLGRRG